MGSFRCKFSPPRLVSTLTALILFVGCAGITPAKAVTPLESDAATQKQVELKSIEAELKRQHEIINGKAAADLKIINCNILDVYSEVILKNGSLLIDNGKILVVNPTQDMKAVETYDAKGMYALPGFIDAHFHFESQTVAPAALGELVSPSGTTTIFGCVCDFTSAAEKDAVSSLKKLIKQREDLPYNLFVFAPGKKVAVEYVKQILDMDEVIGLGELNHTLFLSGNPDEYEKIAYAKSLGKMMNSHGEFMMDPKETSLYAAYGADNSHFSNIPAHLVENLQSGLPTQLCEGLGDLDRVIPYIVENKLPTENIMLCTDNYTIQQLDRGHINACIQKAIDLGIDPISAIKMATFNTAVAFKMQDTIGSLTPGRMADIVLVKDIKQITTPSVVFKSGIIVSENGSLKEKSQISYKDLYTTTTPGLTDMEKSDFALPLEYNADKTKVKVKIVWAGGNTETYVTEHWLDVVDGKIKPIYEDGTELTRILIVERFAETGKERVILNGYMRNFTLESGAMSVLGKTTRGWYIMTLGKNEEDIYVSTTATDKLSGGYAIADGGKVKGSIDLPIYGMMSDMESAPLLDSLNQLSKTAEEMGYKDSSPKQWYQRMFSMFFQFDRFSIL